MSLAELLACVLERGDPLMAELGPLAEANMSPAERRRRQELQRLREVGTMQSGAQGWILSGPLIESTLAFLYWNCSTIFEVTRLRGRSKVCMCMCMWRRLRLHACKCGSCLPQA